MVLCVCGTRVMPRSASARHASKVGHPYKRPQCSHTSAHSAGVQTTAFSSDAQLFASGSFDKTVCLWRTEDAVLLRSVSFPTKICAVAFQHDLPNLYVCSKTIVLLDTATGSEVRCFDRLTVRSYGLAVWTPSPGYSPTDS
jgi:WD40 repeat protein